MQNTKYYFLLASQEFLISKEPLEEVLRERTQYYTKTKTNIDFWLLPSPNFAELGRYKFIKDRFSQNSLAIVSTNKVFITWLKLRLNQVFIGEFSGPNEKVKNPLDFDYTKIVFDKIELTFNNY